MLLRQKQVYRGHAVLRHAVLSYSQPALVLRSPQAGSLVHSNVGAYQRYTESHLDAIVSLRRLVLGSAAASAMRMMVRADFPDAFRANLWVRGMSQDKSAEEALSDFKVDASRLLCLHCT